jgi:hypothetical protein
MTTLLLLNKVMARIETVAAADTAKAKKYMESLGLRVNKPLTGYTTSGDNHISFSLLDKFSEACKALNTALGKGTVSKSPSWRIAGKGWVQLINGRDGVRAILMNKP